MELSVFSLFKTAIVGLGTKRDPKSASDAGSCMVRDPSFFFVGSWMVHDPDYTRFFSENAKNYVKLSVFSLFKTVNFGLRTTRDPISFT